MRSHALAQPHDEPPLRDADAPRPTLVVFVHSDAFAELWPRLANTVGAELRVVDEIAELSTVHEACGMLVAAGGDEEDALSLVQELRGVVSPHLGAVGTSRDYRLVASFFQSGATDYFALPDDLGLLHAWAAECVERAARVHDAEALHAFTRAQYDFSRIVGESPEIRRALQRAAKVIPREDATVLLTGETGTGKELFAQAIHFNGPRGTKPFVEINCTALPGTLLESELFGYEKGAFTDARTSKPGLFEVANGGTMFLDEIGDLPLELQPKLLKVLETGRIRRLGGIKESDADFRIIAATHTDLAAAVRDGRFRQDLYFRLNVVRIHLPPLRDRGNDILLIAERFLDHFSRKYGLNCGGLDRRARDLILSHTWPGNIRELKNAFERAVLLHNGRLLEEELEEFRDILPASTYGFHFPTKLDDLNRAAAHKMLQIHNGNKLKAAKALGISRKYLYRLLENAD